MHGLNMIMWWVFSTKTRTEMIQESGEKDGDRPSKGRELMEQAHKNLEGLVNSETIEQLRRLETFCIRLLMTHENRSQDEAHKIVQQAAKYDPKG